jgi:hypothetical protein
MNFFGTYSTVSLFILFLDKALDRKIYFLAIRCCPALPTPPSPMGFWTKMQFLELRRHL